MQSVNPEDLESLLGFERTVDAVACAPLVDGKPDEHIRHLNGLHQLLARRQSLQQPLVARLQEAAFSVVRQVVSVALSNPSGTSVVRVGLQVAKTMESLRCVQQGVCRVPVRAYTRSPSLTSDELALTMCPPALPPFSHELAVT